MGRTKNVENILIRRGFSFDSLARVCDKIIGMKAVDRSEMVTRLTTLDEADDAGDLRGSTTPQQRWEMMTELSNNLYEFKEKCVAQPRLHRHIVRVFRRES